MANISLVVYGDDELYESLDELRDAVNKGIWEVLRNVAATTKTSAEEGYATWGGDGGNTVWVDIKEEPENKTIRVFAEGAELTARDGSPAGNMVVMEEFGAGKLAGSHPLATEYGVYPGQWSQEHGYKQYRPGHEKWKHGKIWHTEIEPTQAMYKAGEDAKARLIEEVRRVFG